MRETGEGGTTTGHPPGTVADAAGSGSWPRWRIQWAVLVVVIVSAAWLIVGAVLPPVRQSCDPALTEPVCLETIDASLRKGMPPLHPWLLSAHAEPGPAARPDQFGHRATVTFAVLGLPDPVSVRMFFDAGGHWGGIADLDGLLLVGFALVSAVAIGAAATTGWWLVIRRRARGPADPGA